MFCYWTHKLRGMLVDIKRNKNCNATWCRKRRLEGENREKRIAYPRRWIGRAGPIVWPPSSPDPTLVTFSYGVTFNDSFMRRLWTHRRISSRQTSKSYLAYSNASGNRFHVVADFAMTSAAATYNNSCNN
ncbi:hypothetical protein AVEN_74519-1 [Araneus ventricosus]|uniref:Uncharacterized protein n=1 Tax=Araneus ventricosus TaxID=182803 RepID=A0A4Y2GRW5_ARAVE|nr:hypothetical protein AVEN_74519-1 [Araneus ventricosus]